jgi:hypothetical protein
MKRLIIILSILLIADKALAESHKKVKYRKTQEVNFDETNIDGVVRSPDGAYLLQKRGVKFLPLYKIDLELEKNVVGSVEYMK